jgi:hypothetical protein
VRVPGQAHVLFKGNASGTSEKRIVIGDGRRREADTGQAGTPLEGIIANPGDIRARNGAELAESFAGRLGACSKSGIVALQTPKYRLAGSIEPKVRRARKPVFFSQ